MLSKLKYIIFLLPLFLSSCFTIQPVEFKNAENITTKKMEKDYEVTLDLAMYNPNQGSLRLTNIQTKIMIDDLPLGEANVSEVVRIKSNSDFTLPVNGKASFSNLMNLSGIGLKLLLGNGTATATIKGNMTLKKFIFRKKVLFEYKEKIDSKILQLLF